jgi:hypothetical protein
MENVTLFVITLPATMTTLIAALMDPVVLENTQTRATIVLIVFIPVHNARLKLLADLVRSQLLLGYYFCLKGLLALNRMIALMGIPRLVFTALNVTPTVKRA